MKNFEASMTCQTYEMDHDIRLDLVLYNENMQLSNDHIVLANIQQINSMDTNNNY